MGYPMTFQRVVNRNNLSFDKESEWEWFAHPMVIALDALDRDPETLVSLIDTIVRHAKEAAERYNQKVRLLRNDLNRLQKDAVDERGICNHIAQKLALDPETVAMVLREFMTW